MRFLMPLCDREQFSAHRRRGQRVDPRIHAPPIPGALEVCSELCERHFSYSLLDPGFRGVFAVTFAAPRIARQALRLDGPCLFGLNQL